MDLFCHRRIQTDFVDVGNDGYGCGVVVQHCGDDKEIS